jgi:hypothetical protein
VARFIIIGGQPWPSHGAPDALIAWLWALNPELTEIWAKTALSRWLCLAMRQAGLADLHRLARGEQQCTGRISRPSGRRGAAEWSRAARPPIPIDIVDVLTLFR